MIDPQNLIGVSIHSPVFQSYWGEWDEAGLEMEAGEECLISQPGKGLSIVLDRDMRIDTISMFLGRQVKTDGNYSEYKGIIPDGIKFGDSCRKILDLFGEPDERNDRFYECMGVGILPWKKYKMARYWLNITFDRLGDKVVGVSVSAIHGVKLSTLANRWRWPCQRI